MSSLRNKVQLLESDLEKVETLYENVKAEKETLSAENEEMQRWLLLLWLGLEQWTDWFNIFEPALFCYRTCISYKTLGRHYY